MLRMLGLCRSATIAVSTLVLISCAEPAPRAWAPSPAHAAIPLEQLFSTAGIGQGKTGLKARAATVRNSAVCMVATKAFLLQSLDVMAKLYPLAARVAETPRLRREKPDLYPVLAEVLRDSPRYPQQMAVFDAMRAHKPQMQIIFSSAYLDGDEAAAAQLCELGRRMSEGQFGTKLAHVVDEYTLWRAYSAGDRTANMVLFAPDIDEAKSRLFRDAVARSLLARIIGFDPWDAESFARAIAKAMILGP